MKLHGWPWPRGGVPAPNMRADQVESEYRALCLYGLYMRQGVRIFCGEDRKDE